MSQEQAFKDTLQSILSAAVEQHRDQLLLAFAPMANDAMSRRFGATSFQAIADQSVRDTLNRKIAPLLTAHVDRQLDSLIADRMADPDVRALIHSRVSEWLSGVEFERLIADRVSLHLHSLLTTILDREYNISAEDYREDDD